jgi:uncharacterized membrane protein
LRLVLEDRNSYWLDEIYQVTLFGLDNNPSLPHLLHTVGNEVQTPLYYIIIYEWIKIFGDGEVSTRLLSNLLVTFSTLLLFSLSRKIYSERVALASAIFYSFMYMPIYYGLETRQYCMVLFLCTLSSLILVHYLLSLPGAGLAWRDIFQRNIIYLWLANFALVMTHYYSVFFIAAQGLFVFIFFVRLAGRKRFRETIIKSALVVSVPVLMLLTLWGPVMVHSYKRFSKKFAVESLPLNPISIFGDMVIKPNFMYFSLSIIVVALLLAPLVPSVLTLRTLRPTSVQNRAWFTVYFFVWAFVPCIFASLLFLLAGAERYNPRYFIFCTPPLAVLLVLGVEECVKLVDRIAAGFRKLPVSWYYLRYNLIIILATAGLLVAPGGYRAATERKPDWRGIAAEIVALTEGRPDKRFIIYETAFRKYPTLNYYLARFSPTVRVYNTVLPVHEKRKWTPFQGDAEEISKYDYLVLAFTHHSVQKFGNTVKRLSKRYKLAFKLLNPEGRGLLIFEVKDTH